LVEYNQDSSGCQMAGPKTWHCDHRNDAWIHHHAKRVFAQ
jgi:hypothetical protein